MSEILTVSEVAALLRLSKSQVYEKTPKRKAYKKAYEKTPKRKAYKKAYEKTPKYKAYKKAYEKTPKRKAYMKAYKQTPEYKAKERVYMRQVMLFRRNPLAAMRRLANLLSHQGEIHEEISNNPKARKRVSRIVSDSAGQVAVHRPSASV